MAQVIASLMATIGADTRGFEAGSKKVKGGMSDIAKTIGGAVPASVAQFATLSGAIIGVGAAMKSSMDETVKYANQVRTILMKSTSQVKGKVYLPGTKKSTKMKNLCVSKGVVNAYSAVEMADKMSKY